MWYCSFEFSHQQSPFFFLFFIPSELCWLLTSNFWLVNISHENFWKPITIRSYLKPSQDAILLHPLWLARKMIAYLNWPISREYTNRVKVDLHLSWLFHLNINNRHRVSNMDNKRASIMLWVIRMIKLKDRWPWHNLLGRRIQAYNLDNVILLLEFMLLKTSCSGAFMTEFHPEEEYSGDGK